MSFSGIMHSNGFSRSAKCKYSYSGKSVNPRSPLGWPDVAAAILHDYSNALANSTQLNLLIGALKQDQSILKGK